MMSKRRSTPFEREFAATLRSRLREPRRFLHLVAGPRQVGKTTLVQQVLARPKAPSLFVSADEPALRSAEWLATQWERARDAAAAGGVRGAVLAVDEIQKVAGWSETVKRLWDEDTRKKRNLKVILLGSAPLLLQQGMTESLAGRFETLRLPHWSLTEMQKAFAFTVEQYIHFGGYPGAAPLVSDPQRWRAYILDSLVETTISRDVLLLTRVHKPALLRRLFDLGCRYSGQILSYTKMLGQLHEAGNTTTLAHYLDLLAGAGMLVGLPKYSGRVVRQRASSPKLQVLNNALLSAMSGLLPHEARADREFFGRMVESAVGAHLANAATRGICELYYWREGNDEVDFVLRAGREIVAIEVKSGRARRAQPGLVAFSKAHRPRRSLIVGPDGIPVNEFLATPVERWLGE